RVPAAKGRWVARRRDPRHPLDPDEVGGPELGRVGYRSRPVTSEITAYDRVAYPGRCYAQTHPDRLRLAARLCGLEPAPIDRCRVLELACGDGTNLIAMAVGLPSSTFIGIDA